MNELLTPADIERLAKDAGLTIPEVCRRAGVAHTTFYRWKSGEHEPTLGVYRRIRDAAEGRAPAMGLSPDSNERPAPDSSADRQDAA